MEIPTDALTMQDCQPTLDAYRMAIGVTADGRAILFHKTIGYWP